MQFAVGITLFHPENAAVAYLATLVDTFSRVYVYDNSGDNQAYRDQIDSRCVYFHTGSNDGLSVAFNRFLAQATEDNIDYLLLLDQDSMYQTDSLKALMADIAALPADDTVAIRACRAQPAGVKTLPPSPQEITPAYKVISSGSFLNMACVKRYQLQYDENLFVDYVDDDFCKQINSKQLKIRCHTRYTLLQDLGYRYNGRICHSAVRHYYMVRDLGYWNRKYYSEFSVQLRSLVNLLRDLAISFREDKTAKKLRYALRGYLHFLQNKHGECPK